MSTDQNRHDEFFVGYLPAPQPVRRFAITATISLIAGVALVGIVVASMQQSPGTGTWDTSTATTFDGLALVDPYAMLRVKDRTAAGGDSTILLVSEGKFGAADRIRPFHGKAVRIRGTILRRDGRRMLEVSSADNAVELLNPRESALSELAPAPRTEMESPVTLRGEMIDPKCYIGAMKPGGGKTHKACAQLCVGGGIPPMFVTRDSEGRESYFLVVLRDGSAANEAAIPFLGDATEIHGELEIRDDLNVLRIDPKKIIRL